MKINSKLDALHTMAMIRRTELTGFAYTSAGDKIWMELFTACERFFEDHSCCAWETFANR